MNFIWTQYNVLGRGRRVVVRGIASICLWFNAVKYQLPVAMDNIVEENVLRAFCVLYACSRSKKRFGNFKKNLIWSFPRTWCPKLSPCNYHNYQYFLQDFTVLCSIKKQTINLSKSTQQAWVSQKLWGSGAYMLWEAFLACLTPWANHLLGEPFCVVVDGFYFPKCQNAIFLWELLRHAAPHKLPPWAVIHATHIRNCHCML